MISEMARAKVAKRGLWVVFTFFGTLTVLDQRIYLEHVHTTTAPPPTATTTTTTTIA